MNREESALKMLLPLLGICFHQDSMFHACFGANNGNLQHTLPVVGGLFRVLGSQRPQNPNTLLIPRTTNKSTPVLTLSKEHTGMLSNVHRLLSARKFGSLEVHFDTSRYVIALTLL
jgi:hypothetical protein